MEHLARDCARCSRCRTRGVEFKGGSLHDGFEGFGGSGKHLALLSLVLQNTAERGNNDGFDGFGGFSGCGGFRSLKLNPLFSHPELRCQIFDPLKCLDDTDYDNPYRERER